MDKLESMRVFIEAAKQQSFVAAGERLGLSVPSVTRAIASLEQKLGAKLFNRTTRLVRLTDSGARYLQDVQRIMEDLEEAEAALAGVYTQPKGALRITAPVLFGEKHVMPIVSEYLAANPAVEVTAMFYDRVTSLLEEELDVAIRIDRLKDSSLYATQVGQVRRVICGSPDYFDAHGIPESPEDLKTPQHYLPSRE